MNTEPMPGRVVEIPVETYRSLVDHLRRAHSNLYSLDKYVDYDHEGYFNREAMREIKEALEAIGGSV